MNAVSGKILESAYIHVQRCYTCNEAQIANASHSLNYGDGTANQRGDTVYRIKK
jgi:hypothetical protein